MTDKDAKNIVNAKHKLYKAEKVNTILLNVVKTIACCVVTNFGAVIVNIPFFYDNEPVVGILFHVAAVLMGIALSLNSHSHFNRDEELSTLKQLKFELTRGTNRFKNVDIENFDNEFNNLVKANSKKPNIQKLR